MYTKVICEILD